MAQNYLYALRYKGLYFTPNSWAAPDPAQTFKTRNPVSSKLFTSKAGAQKFIDKMMGNAKVGAANQLQQLESIEIVTFELKEI